MLRLHHRRAELQRCPGPLPVAAARTAGERERFAEQTRFFRRVNFKAFANSAAPSPISWSITTAKSNASCVEVSAQLP